jgi:PadR family transcriptional regulator
LVEFAYGTFPRLLLTLERRSGTLLSLVERSAVAEHKSDVLQGTLDMLVLRALQLEPMHGWGITERIEQWSESVLQLGQGTLYPALYRLERQGLIRSAWRVTENNRRGRYYSLTPQGRRHLNQEVAAWRRMSRAIDLVLETTLDSGGA